MLELEGGRLEIVKFHITKIADFEILIKFPFFL